MNPALSICGVPAIWSRAELSYNDPAADFRFARAGACSDVLLSEDETGGISGSVMVGHGGHRGWPYQMETSLTRRPGARGGNLRVRPAQARQALARARLLSRGGGELRRAHNPVLGWRDPLPCDSAHEGHPQISPNAQYSPRLDSRHRRSLEGSGGYHVADHVDVFSGRLVGFAIE